MHQCAVGSSLPDRRTIVHLVLSGAGAAEGWLDIDERTVTVCREDPGRDVDLTLEAETAHMHRWLVGVASFRELTVDGHVRLHGPARLVRAFPEWFSTTAFAEGLRRGRLRRDQEAVSP